MITEIEYFVMLAIVIVMLVVFEIAYISLLAQRLRNSCILEVKYSLINITWAAIINLLLGYVLYCTIVTPDIESIRGLSFMTIAGIITLGAILSNIAFAIYDLQKVDYTAIKTTKA